MKINLIEADQLVNFIYWNEEKNEYDTMLCSVIEYLHCYCDISQLDIYKLERDYEKENKSFIKECLIILFVGIIVNATCFLMSTIYSKAENVQYFPFESGYNENNINVNQSFIDEQMSNGAFLFVVIRTLILLIQIECVM